MKSVVAAQDLAGRLRTGAAEWSGLGARLYRNVAGAQPPVVAGAPVISVGALTVGGAGKTPLTALVVARLRAMGRHPAVVSRGYGRRSRGPLLVARGAGPDVPVAAAGDEAWLLARQTAAIVAVGEDRAAASALAVAAGADVLVLDDGFQHRRLHRALDVVLVDPSAPAPFVLPFGPGREPPSALARADLVVSYGLADAPLGPTVDAHAWAAPEAWCGVGGEPRPAPTRVLLASAIARPHRFRATVEGLGVSVVGHTRWRDHAWISARAAAGAFARAERRGADGVAITEKDAVRWPSTAGPAERLWVLPIRARLGAGADRVERALDAALA